MKFQAVTENHLYKKAYRAGKKKSSRSVTVYVMKDKAAALLRKRHPMKITVNRIGISASKKVGGAVQRNRAKRVIREAYRLIDKTFGVKRGWIIIIVPKPACTVCSMKECLGDLTYCLRALDMLMPKKEENHSPAQTSRNECGENSIGEDHSLTKTAQHAQIEDQDRHIPLSEN